MRDNRAAVLERQRVFVQQHEKEHDTIEGSIRSLEQIVQKHRKELQHNQARLNEVKAELSFLETEIGTLISHARQEIFL